MKEMPPPPPAGGAKWQYNPQIENHYNTLLQNIFNNCDKKSESDSQVVWDVVSFDKKSGRLTFDDQTPLYPWEIEFEIDDKKSFRKKFETEKIGVGDNFYIFKLEIKGQFSADGLIASAKSSVFYSDNPIIIPAYSCHREYMAYGKKRYTTLAHPAATIEGEYKALTKVISNTCPAEKFPQIFSMTLMPKNKNGDLYYLRLNDIYLGNLPVVNGKIDNVPAVTEYEWYLISGEIKNGLISLNIKIGGTGCAGQYEISAIKRFEEADVVETMIDGIYSVIVSITKETTCDKPHISERFHLNAVQINDHQARILLGGKDFMAEIYADQSFKARFTSDASKNPAIPFSGTITPDMIAGKMKLTISNLIAATSCDIFYNISGQKLYKHY